jgi:hypothetical protein
MRKRLRQNYLDTHEAAVFKLPQHSLLYRVVPASQESFLQVEPDLIEMWRCMPAPESIPEGFHVEEFSTRKPLFLHVAGDFINPCNLDIDGWMESTIDKRVVLSRTGFGGLVLIDSDKRQGTSQMFISDWLVSGSYSR